MRSVPISVQGERLVQVLRVSVARQVWSHEEWRQSLNRAERCLWSILGDGEMENESVRGERGGERQKALEFTVVSYLETKKQILYNGKNMTKLGSFYNWR